MMSHSYGRKNGHMVEEKLQAFLEVERGILTIHQLFFDCLGDLLPGSICLLIPSIEHIRSSGALGSQEHLLRMKGPFWVHPRAYL